MVLHAGGCSPCQESHPSVALHLCPWEWLYWFLYGNRDGLKSDKGEDTAPPNGGADSAAEAPPIFREDSPSPRRGSLSQLNSTTGFRLRFPRPVLISKERWRTHGPR